MSGFLFILVLGRIMRQSVEDKNTGIRWNFTSKLEDLKFAEDTALQSGRKSDMKEKLQRTSETAETTGLEINVNKTKAIRITTKVKDPLKIKNEEIEDVDKFTYLGTLVSKEGETINEIKKITKSQSSIQPTKNKFGYPTSIAETPK